MTNIPQDLAPTSISRQNDDTIIIEWNDGSSSQWSTQELRKACPCATCREKKRSAEVEPKSMSLPVLSAAEAQPLRIESMSPVGSYAYNIQFSDGHSSGIYPFARLFRNGEG